MQDSPEVMDTRIIYCDLPEPNGSIEYRSVQNINAFFYNGNC